jgi:hypothetical protein
MSYEYRAPPPNLVAQVPVIYLGSPAEWRVIHDRNWDLIADLHELCMMGPATDAALQSGLIRACDRFLAGLTADQLDLLPDFLSNVSGT